MSILKPAAESDFALVESLACSIWTEHYTPIIGKAQVEYMLQKMYSPQALKEQTTKGQQFFLVVDEEKKIGFVSISSTDKENFFLHKFYILQKRQKSGLGTKVFRELFEELYKPESIRLTVNRQNFKSVNFYFKLGFTIEKVEDFDIGNGYFMNDFVMLWKKK
jgi:ribosomal protein S18 acetylase RimI-like enzyme